MGEREMSKEKEIKEHGIFITWDENNKKFNRENVEKEILEGAKKINNESIILKNCKSIYSLSVELLNCGCKKVWNKNIPLKNVLCKHGNYFLKYDIKNKELKETKKVCELCGKVDDGTKRFNQHHISYELDKTIYICFNCRQLVHGRNTWHNPFEKKFGKDKGFYELAKRFIELYEKRMGLTDEYEERSCQWSSEGMK